MEFVTTELEALSGRTSGLYELDFCPSLKPYLPEAIQKAYEDGIDLVVRETLLNDRDLPQTCPYQPEQILDRSFLPGEPLESDWQEWGRYRA